MLRQGVVRDVLIPFRDIPTYGRSNGILAVEDAMASRGRKPMCEKLDP